MLFNNIASAAAAACVLLVPSVLAEVRLQWHPSGSCSTSGGPQRVYGTGVCISLSSTSNSVNILSRQGSCNLVTYTANGCSGGRRVLNSNGCWTLSGRNSARVEC
ncbi:hypothetical protein CGRA01v4_04641 [Colletotrichum graminicola]|uniref:Cyanovirin-N domain-containing protein n=1 Tax=Colletotrichum graminicola (strain M1.001 / M2 / FGSC 10212) TaxID=645133 RepID=E3Q922_COLGM|nr:uncharacterized protein GLRG_02031 [Colletotrichum graminicola M1.001]EFQ27536.1 hypothetical protein GLRG_02031 [Colletotrichum graminicola M1.001]WDK13360.1 hypothetical protein CGRA01v4_04641 [Colletotrichum graminicola]